MFKHPPLYFGPVTEQPSWKWVGEDIAKFLSVDYDVRFFEKPEDIERESVVFWVKCLPEKAELEQCARKRLTVIFFPVDVFMSPAHIRLHQEFLDQVSIVCLHASSLRPYFPENKTVFIDHYNKYGVNCSERRSDGRTLLWIGGFQYVPYVLHGLNEVDWPRENITLLTNPNLPAARAAARRNAESIGIGDYEARLEECPLNVVNWTEDSQRTALLSCAGAFDIKHLAHFNQYHKPATKLQKYLASGIPCAVNEDFPPAKQLTGVVRLRDLPAKIKSSNRSEADQLGSLLTRKLRLECIADTYLHFAKSAISGKRTALK